MTCLIVALGAGFLGGLAVFVVYSIALIVSARWRQWWEL